MTTSKMPALSRRGPAGRRFGDRYVIAADRVFDGRRVLESHAVAVSGDRIEAVAPADRLSGPGERILFSGTLLPGFIDLHAHLRLGQVPPEIVLRHGLTTIRETGGPLAPPSGGDGRLRVLAAGPILTAPGGYPIPVFGPGAGLEVADVRAARNAVGELASGGASFIKIALEPGQSPGAPWTMHAPASPPPWSMPPLEVVQAIVGEAHVHGLIVAAHLSGPEGAALALDAGVDEWAHVPCDPLPPDMVARAAAAGVRVVSTLDTLSHCTGVAGNARQLAEAGIELLYGTDLAHTDVPWGIDAQELALMVGTANGVRTPLQVLSAATARAGEHLGLAPLGQLAEGAPADLIGVRGGDRAAVSPPFPGPPVDPDDPARLRIVKALRDQPRELLTLLHLRQSTRPTAPHRNPRTHRVLRRPLESAGRVLTPPFDGIPPRLDSMLEVRRRLLDLASRDDRTPRSLSATTTSSLW